MESTTVKKKNNMGSTLPKNAFARAVQSSYEEWVNEIDKSFAEAQARGEIPEVSREQMQAKAKAIWQKARMER